MPSTWPPVGIPAAEVEISEGLVRDLLATQHPDLAGLELRFHGSGWDNTTYRLGADMAVRLPRRQEAAALILKEQRWLPDITDLVTIAVPAPVRTGAAGSGYPWPWSVVPWIGGEDAVAAPLHPQEAGSVARMLRSLHQPAPPDAPHNEHRGIPLRDRSASIEARIARIDLRNISVPRSLLAALWNRAAEVPNDAPSVWIHADMHPRNVITFEGRLRALVDWGDLCSGDPAADLSAAWMLFDTDVHAAFRAGYGPMSDATWERARGWAISFGAILIDGGTGHDEPWADAGRRILERACG